MNSLKSKIAQLLFIAMVLVLCCGNKNYISELNDKITNTKTIWEQPREAFLPPLFHHFHRNLPHYPLRQERQRDPPDRHRIHYPQAEQGNALLP